MAKQRLNTSDRKVIDTQGGALRDPDFRLPEVDIVGYGTNVNQNAGSGASPPDPSNPVTDREVGVPADIQIENMAVRVQSDGAAVVDVLVSYIPADGARSHEMRISRL